MIYIRIELWKQGDSLQRQLLSEIKIWNEGGTRMSSQANYGYRIMGRGRKMHEGRVPGFRRARRHVLDLLTLVLQHARKDVRGASKADIHPICFGEVWRGPNDFEQF
jgi:hypothetical protein